MHEWPIVRTTQGLKRLDALAQRYHCRPSDLLGLTDVYLAYCVDEACAVAATHASPPPATMDNQGRISGTIPRIPRPPDAPIPIEEQWLINDSR